ncbi:hypothetical protein EDC04DRAFT_2615029 [Pisolithus marmoratus]|nr:hypothetical protein EDC04DRAFT_2615029 [Pisolithus marmoratus]
MAMANKPLNPLALVKSKPKLKTCVKMSSASASDDGQLPNSLQNPTNLNRVPLPTYQVAVGGSQYSFHLAESDKQHGEDNVTPAPTSHAGKRRVSYQTTTTFHVHQPVMMAFLLKVSSICKAVVVLMLLSMRYHLMKKIEQLRVWFETISNKLKNITVKTISLMLQILNVYIMFINSSSLIAQLHSNKMCCWMNLHLQLLPNKLQLLCGAASDPIPSRAWFIDEKSALYITEAMAECEQMGMLIPCGYWPDYHMDLGILGTMHNMASPALAGLIIDFFYATPSALSNLFPELQAAIDKYAVMGIQQDRQLESSTYSNDWLGNYWDVRVLYNVSLGRKMAIASEDDFEVVLN